MDSEFLQWDNNNVFMTESNSPGISMDSGFNEGNPPTSPSFASLQAFSPNYGNFNSPLQQQQQQPISQYENYSSPSTSTIPQQDWFESTQISTEPVFLEIREQPNENFRFRYPTEMQGPHGTIKGSSSGGNGGRSTLKSFPTVILHNYTSTSEVVVKCCLYQKESEGEAHRILHPHKLAMRPAEHESHDPHYVKATKQNNYTVVFGGLGIIQTKKEQMADVLLSKVKKEREFEGNRFLTSNEIEEIRADSKLRVKRKIEINQVALGFTAFMKDILSNEWIKITETVYSNLINNEKSVNGKLSIARISSCKGEAKGGDEIFMFVTKVDKNTIQVRFFETDNGDPDGQSIWESNGIFTSSDVHHQYGIVLKTPPYRNQQIVEDVTVFIQLYRKNSPNKGRSEAVPFIYKPNRFKRKIPRPPASIPTVVTTYENSNSPSSSPSIQTASENEQNANDSIGSKTTHRHEQEHEDSEIINLILKITAEGYESPTSDIPSIVRDLRSGYEIDAAVPNVSSQPFTLCPSFEYLKNNENLFDLLVRTINGDQYAFADLVESGTIEDIQAFTFLIAKYKLTHALNATNDLDQNLLHLCILRGYINMFKLFVKLGVDVNHSDARGQTPLHLAVMANFDEGISFLLSSHKLKLDEINDQGETALYLSVVESNAHITKILIDSGADPRIKNTTNGFNCLHAAVNLKEPSLAMIKLLTEVDNSMIFIKTNSGRNVVQLATANGLSEDIISYLTSFNDASLELELDEICLSSLCKIFDSRNNWHVLAMLMDIEEKKIGDWEGLESPSRALFSYIKNSKKSLEDLIGLFDLLNDAERVCATSAIDEMIARKFEE